MELSEWRRWWRERGEQELQSLLMAKWDPIGANDESGAADEYDIYALPLAGKLREGASVHDMARYLDTVEVERMGMDDPGPRNEATAEAIRRWYAESTAQFANSSN